MFWLILKNIKMSGIYTLSSLNPTIILCKTVIIYLLFNSSNYTWMCIVGKHYFYKQCETLDE